MSNFSPVRNAEKSTPNRQSTHRSFFHRLNARFPWLKIVALIAVIAIIIVDFTSILIPRTSDSPVVITTAPMRKHARIAEERDLTNRQLIALTFDDGPSTATTPLLLDILKEKQVHATFFMLGTKAEANPDLVRRAEAEGHDVGSHTMYHQNLKRLSTADALSDIAEANQVFESILGHGPAYLRTPYGNHTSDIRASVNVPIILWSSDTLDWKNRTTESIVEIALSQVKEGAIILMHDTYSTSVEAVPVLIDTLRREGYEFVSVSELASLHHQSLSPGSVYYYLSPNP